MLQKEAEIWEASGTIESVNMGVCRFVVCECKIEALISHHYKIHQKMSKVNGTPLEISASDTFGVILGDRRSGKSTLCNRLCTTVNFPQDGREVADVLDSTSEPCVYNLKNSQHNKILDISSYRSRELPDDDMASFATRNHLHRADFVIIVFCHRSLPLADVISWCQDNQKPTIAVATRTSDLTKFVMREEKCCHSDARIQVGNMIRDIAEDLREDKIPFFAVDTDQWQTAIEAYEAGNYDAAQLHYDEGELLKFVARAGQAKSAPGGSVSAFFQSYTEQSRKKEADSYETTQLDTVLLDVHHYSRNRLYQSNSGGVSSVKTQTELPPTASPRAVRLAPTFFQ